MKFPKAEGIRKILVIAPHADDEVIGCGGIIARAAKNGSQVKLVVMATGGIKHHHLEEIASTDDRLAEMKSAAQTLGIRATQVLFPGRDMRLEELPMLELVTALDGVIRADDFDECYIPEPSHNRDHQLTNEAAIAALRPSGRRPMNLVAAYEGTSYDFRTATTPAGTLYVDIAATLDSKIEALHHYTSQARTYPHPMSEEAIRRLAAMRGMECGVDYAERFRVLRMVHT